MTLELRLFPAPAYRSGAAGGRGRGDFHQRRLTECPSGAGGSPRARRSGDCGPLGYGGAGKLFGGAWSNSALIVPSNYIPRIQEVQASIYHIIRENLEALTHA